MEQKRKIREERVRLPPFALENMKLFDFLKKIIGSNKIEEIKKEQLDFYKIKNWIESKTKQNEIKEKEIFDLINNKISEFCDELKEKTEILKNVDVESKKVEEKIKVLVNESRKKYIESIEIFIDKLKNLENKELGEFFNKISLVFSNFDKNSHMNYEKTTVLIGKETADIREKVNIFSKEIAKVFDENKNLIDSSKSIFFIKSKLAQITQTEKITKEVGETKALLNKKIINKKQENENFLEKIKKIKKSSDYLEHLKKQEKIKFLNEELKKEIFDLKQVLDFKALANFFHINQEQMDILKAHKEDFQTNFQKDNGTGILSLLDEANLNNKVILEKTKQIKFKTNEIAKNKQEIKKNEAQELSCEIKKIILEIEDLNIKKNKEEKRYEKLEANKENSIDLLKQEFNKINVELMS